MTALRKPPPRPIRRPETKGRPIWRVPDYGYVLPRLRQPEPKDAIGFKWQSRDDDDGES